MPTMRDQFANFYAPDEDDIVTAMKPGLVVPAANVLLNFLPSLASLGASRRRAWSGAVDRP